MKVLRCETVLYNSLTRWLQLGIKAGGAERTFPCPKAGIFTETAGRGTKPENTLQIRDFVGLWMVRSFLFAVTVGLVIGAVDVYRIVPVIGKGPAFRCGRTSDRHFPSLLWAAKT
jgi:hypothetical protein